MKLNTDRTAVHLELSGTYNAAELEALLRKLALLRADMAPAVPMTRDELDAQALVLAEDKPGLRIAQRQDGGFRLWLRHRGYGWLAYQLDARSAAGAANFIASKTAGVEAIDFISQGGGQAH